VIRDERSIKPGNSWFSVKSILVECGIYTAGVELLDRYWVARCFTEPNQTPNTAEGSACACRTAECASYTINRLRVIRSVVEREKAQIVF